MDTLQPLFDQATGGDEVARWELVRLFEPLIINVAVGRVESAGQRRSPYDDRIDEIRFQTMITVHEKFDHFEGELRQFPKWIRTIAWRIGSRVLDAGAKADHRQVPLDALVGAGVNQPEPDEQVQEQLEMESLRKCMTQLAEVKPDLVDLLRLHYREGRSSDEIAAIARHSLDPSGIRRKIRTARNFLRLCMEGGGVMQ